MSSTYGSRLTIMITFRAPCLPLLMVGLILFGLRFKSDALGCTMANANERSLSGLSVNDAVKVQLNSVELKRGQVEERKIRVSAANGTSHHARRENKRSNRLRSH